MRKKVVTIVTSRPVSFTCRHCQQAVTEERFPGPLPHYCARCSSDPEVIRARARVRKAKQRQQAAQVSQNAPDAPPVLPVPPAAPPLPAPPADRRPVAPPTQPASAAISPPTVPIPSEPPDWQWLSAQQQSVLHILLDRIESQAEQEELRLRQGERMRPPNVWRWLPYNQHYGISTDLKQALDAKLPGRALSATLKVLAQQGLIDRRRPSDWVSGDDVEITLTSTGEALVRAALQRPATAPLPPGALREWQWAALIKAARAGAGGLRSEGVGTYGRIPWATWLQLRSYSGGQLITEVRRYDPRENEDVAWLVATAFAFEFIRLRAKQHQALYPKIIVPASLLKNGEVKKAPAPPPPSTAPAQDATDDAWGTVLQFPRGGESHWPGEHGKTLCGLRCPQGTERQSQPANDGAVNCMRCKAYHS